MRWIYLFLSASAITILDRITKYIAVNNLSQGQSIKVLPGIFHVTLIFNNGAAFGLFKNQGLLFISLSFIAVFVIIVYLWRHAVTRPVVSAALGLIAGGAIGNLIDRIRLNYVIDFFDFRIWPVFNVADSAITIGMIILAMNLLLQKEGRKVSQS